MLQHVAGSMSTVAAMMASPKSTSFKRTYDEAGLEDAGQDHRDAKTILGEQTPVENSLDPSGTLTLRPSAAEQDRPELLLPTDADTVAGSLCTQSTLNTPLVSNANKRIKLTAAEKDVKKLEKETKDRQRAEEKEKKEEEKRIRDAEKEERRRLKEEQSRLKEEEKKLKDDEKKRKDEEKRLKEEEKEKKAKASNP